jgi:hypothetical protein
MPLVAPTAVERALVYGGRAKVVDGERPNQIELLVPDQVGV